MLSPRTRTYYDARFLPPLLTILFFKLLIFLLLTIFSSLAIFGSRLLLLFRDLLILSTLLALSLETYLLRATNISRPLLALR